MLRPPQPAVYIFLMDVSRQAVETGYINSFCNILLEELDKLPGDSRTQVKIHNYEICSELNEFSNPIMGKSSILFNIIITLR